MTEKRGIHVGDRESSTRERGGALVLVTRGRCVGNYRLSLFHGWNVVHGWRAIEGGGLERCDSEAFCEKDASRRASVSVPVPS
jgi:hypothetical protein